MNNYINVYQGGTYIVAPQHPLTSLSVTVAILINEYENFQFQI
jgi:hypothetical protein